MILGCGDPLCERPRSGESLARATGHTYETLTDKKRRETNDKPCQKIFGACCAKETDNGGKDIKCGGDFEDA